MRSLTLFFLLSVIPFSQRAMAAILTVYNLNNTAIADYANIYEAYNNAADGDTILLYPSDLSYEANLVVTKRVFLIGGGYGSQPLLPATRLCGTITFQAGADGASVESFGGRFNIAINGANHILVSRNHINTIVIENSYNALLTGNLIDGNSGSDGYVLVLNGNCLVEGSNNLLRPQPYSCGYSSTCYYGAVHMRGSSVLHMDNSIFISEGQITIYAEGGSASGKNNLMFGAFRGEVDFHHSIQTNPWNYDGKLDTTTISKNNQIIPDISMVYTDFTANNFTLKPGSPAFGNAEDGSDISIYDGASPFVDGGFPKLPLITHLDVPLTGSQSEGINVTIKVKSQN